ncbi:MAG: nucleotide exchange factor GrpE, partial [Moraxellaceae bacterium]
HEQVEVTQDADFVPSGSTENISDNNDNGDDPITLQQKIVELEAEITDVKARANADMYNFQKRVERETDNAKKYALEKFSTSLLDVVDNLERALQAAGDDDSIVNQPVIEGVRLTHKALLTTLEKHGVSVVDPVGTAFNAEQHEAVGIDPNTPAGQVANVLQKGYLLNGRLLRPAMVIVGQ